MTAMHSPLRDVLLLGPVMRKAASNAAVCVAAAAFEQGKAGWAALLHACGTGCVPHAKSSYFRRHPNLVDPSRSAI